MFGIYETSSNELMMDGFLTRQAAARCNRENYSQGHFTDVREIRAFALSGAQLIRLMRLSGCTIRELAQRSGITQKRIREVRNSGLPGRGAARDWIQAITGSDPGPDWKWEELKC